jgi:hypothetical protein
MSDDGRPATTARSVPLSTTAAPATVAWDRDSVTPDPLNGYLARLLADGAWASSNEATRHIRQVLGFAGPDAVATAVVAAEARGYRTAVERLRSGDGYEAWVADTGRYDVGRDTYADWLEAEAGR